MLSYVFIYLHIVVNVLYMIYIKENTNANLQNSIPDK